MSLTSYLTEGLLPEEEKKQTTAVYAGGFKPPTAGHFEVVEEALKQNPEIDEFIIFIGTKERNGISQDESLLIWEVYNNYLPFKVKLEPTSIPPIKAVYDFAKNHPTREVLWIIGAREGNDEDFKDISARTTSISKYPNLELRTIITQGGVSGTAARNASKVSLEKFIPFLPTMLNPEEQEEVYNIVADKISENDPEDGKAAPYGSGYKKLNENASYKQHIDVQNKIDQLTQHMIDKGMNILPLPSVEFVDGDSENAKDFFGKTAYYDPSEQHIVLYTEGRHPKDIVRSYAHEMIHHIQHLEDRLGDIPGTDTTSSEHLTKLEKEANLRGTMTFRNWTDSLNEETKKINYTNPNFRDEWEEAIRYPEFKKMGIKNWIKIANKGYITNYSKIKDKLGNVDLKFNSLEEPKKQRFQDALNKGNIEMSIAVKFSDNDYDLVAGNTRISGLVKNQIDPKIWIVDLSNDLNEAIVGEKIECDNCGWSWNIVDGGDDLFICHKCGHDNTPLNENINSKLEFQLKNYIEDYSDINVDLLKDLSKIKNKYPKQLDPKSGGNKFAYRGTTFDKDFIKKLKVKSKNNGVIEYKLPSNLKITSRGNKGFLSFSTDEDVAKGFGHYSGYVDHKKSNDRVGGYVKVSLDNPNFILHPNYMGELSKDMEYSKENEKETLYIGNSFTPESIFVIEKDIYNGLQEGKKKDPFGLNAYARELALLREEEGNYKIYLDMDGVIADFNSRFKDLSGIEPREFESKYGRKAFWDFIDEENKIKFWVGIPPMPGASELVSYISKHDYEILTAPSIKDQSRLGKNLWVRNHIGDIFPSKPKVTFKFSKEKHKVKQNLSQFDILIDDRQSIINNWNNAGGFGILYQSTPQAIADLKKLGL